jgi:hypothetical protein
LANDRYRVVLTALAEGDENARQLLRELDAAGSPDTIHTEATSPVNMPSIVRQITGHIDNVAKSGPLDLLGTRLIETLFPVGLRSMPMPEAAVIEDVAGWIKDRQRGRARDGVHNLKTWDAFRGLVERAGEGGIVLTRDRAGRQTFYMKAGDEIWQVRSGPNGIEAKPWTEPTGSTSGMEAPPQMVLAFNKCADPLA